MAENREKLPRILIPAARAQLQDASFKLQTPQTSALFVMDLILQLHAPGAPGVPDQSIHTKMADVQVP
tara:strand:+ start:258 stop:461 length:204 start_codon:yes stop_codon:yes gene_type:complete